MSQRIRNRVILVLFGVLCLAVSFAVAQFRGGQSGGGRYGSSKRYPGSNLWRPRPMPERSEFPTWDVEREFEQDVFTFTRIEYDSFGPFGWWDRWDNDFPDADWNFSHRLQELTALRVAPDSKVVRLTDPDLFDYPFAYMAGVQTITLNQAERAGLRRYLLNGGFLMVDDFWASEAWSNFMREMRKVLPEFEPIELSLAHPIFHCVYDLKELPQVVDIRTWREGYAYEHWHGPSRGDNAPHFWAYFDREGRMMAILCHNNDLGDGWEREGENPEYFRKFSEKYSYPMGINIVTWAMTH